MDKQITNIIRRAIDLHVHIGPEVIPRKYNCDELINKEQGKIAGLALKNHFYSTTPFIRSRKQKNGLRLVGSIVLNNAVGGLNPDAIIAASYVAEKPFIVWLPTINASQFLSTSEFEIAPEWVNRKGFISRKAKDIKGLRVINNQGNITQNMTAVLRTINQLNCILATGHISWQESQIVVKKAANLGIKKIIITHPIYQRVAMPLDVQQELIGYGAFIEHCYSMISIDKISIKKVAEQIKKVGAKNCLLSSDVGQPFSPSPSKALSFFAKQLISQGIPFSDLEIMLVQNPYKLIYK